MHPPDILCSGCAEEHKARLKAEAEAEHATRRLTVAQEQMSEYAQKRKHEAGSLLGEVQALRMALSNAAQQPTADSSAGVGMAAASAQIKVCSETSHAEQSQLIHADSQAGVCNTDTATDEMSAICMA